MSLLNGVRHKHTIHGIEYICDLEELLNHLEYENDELKARVNVEVNLNKKFTDRIQELEEYNEALQETSILNGNLAVKYVDALREIDAHIRAANKPILYIVTTLKKTLPEYND